MQIGVDCEEKCGCLGEYDATRHKRDEEEHAERSGEGENKDLVG